MKYGKYNATGYINSYLKFIPERYQEMYVMPDESYWSWNNHKIHIDSKSNKSNTKTAILIHGAGANGRILSLFGSYLFKNGINYYAPDNLGYGLTKLSEESFEYQDWVSMICDYVKYIQAKENNHVFLIGLSVGGMLAYQVASQVDNIRGLIVTTLADPRDKDTLIALSKNRFLATIGMRLMEAFRFLTDPIKLPIKWFCKMELMSRNPEFSKLFNDDKLAGSVKVPMKFLRTFATYNPAIEFEEFDKCPILLLQPEKDAWTPLEVNQKVYDKLKGNKQIRILKECGHAPIEKPGIHDIEKYTLEFIKEKS